MGEQLEGDLVALPSVPGFLLHDPENPCASVGAVLGLPVDGDGLFRGAKIILAVDIHAGPVKNVKK